MIRLETFIRDAFVNREHVVSVFFDLEKAYDTTWRYGILKDLQDLGLRGRLPVFIRSFLEDRTMKVRVGSTLSDCYDQEQGVPQGSILSTTLFNIKINNIVKCLDSKTDGSLYVDDFRICYRSKNMRTIERKLQQCINRIEDWATSNGFKFSKSKTQCVHFCKLRKVHNDPVLYLYGSPIPVVEESKFLGVIFDRKLSFIPHIRYIKAKCLRALKLLKVLSHTSWGGGWSGGAKVLGKLPVPGRPTILITVGQGSTVLAVDAGGGGLDIFTLIHPFSSLSPSLWETARYRLIYCLKGPLNPKQPTNQHTS